MISVRAGVPVPAAGGARLTTDVHLPAELPAPVVLVRTPYDRSVLRAEGLGWARLGFALVAQDVRGRYGSAGTWVPYAGERADGAALVDWVLDQPWCDGTVVASGASYGAFTAWTTALARPDQVSAVVSQVPAMGTARVAFDPSGVLRLAEHAGWWSEHAEARTSRTGLAAAMLGGPGRVLEHLPVAGIGAHLWAPLPGWWPAVAGGADRRHPESVTDTELADCPVPALHVGGWHDLLVTETLHQWQVAGSALADRPPRALLVGPWGHELSHPALDRVGLRRYGPAGQVPLGPLQARWIRAVTTGAEASWVQVFLSGADRWLDTWPPPARAHVLHACPDGSLRPRPPDRTGRTRFRYDPADPYPSVLAGHDRAPLDTRTDAVTFRATPLRAPLVLAGTPRVRLCASTSAPATDFVVRLVERRCDGAAVEIAGAVVDTARCPDGPRYDLALPATALRLPAGSAIELVVTGGDFPHLARNPNTGGDRATAERLDAADHTVHTGPSSGTGVELPIMEDA